MPSNTMKVTEKNCYNCTKHLLRDGKIHCRVLQNYLYPFRKYGSCWAWSDSNTITQQIYGKGYVEISTKTLNWGGWAIRVMQEA